MTFLCNICGSTAETLEDQLTRESRSCASCGSSMRLRSVIHVLSTELFGKTLTVPEFPVRRDITGLGMSDWEGYATPLATKLNYQNTFYHKEPKLDILHPDARLEGTLDFVICSDVFEHVAPPVSVAFSNLRRLLRPGGVAVFTVPYSKQSHTQEHFPHLHEYEIVSNGTCRVLHNRTKSGHVQIFESLVFHGGAGATLEMRVFAEASLVEEFQRAGFDAVATYLGSVPKFGICWRHTWSLPMAARVAR